jgi:hypothetical protein
MVTATKEGSTQTGSGATKLELLAGVSTKADKK